MPFLFFFPMIVAAGMYQAAAEDMTEIQRAFLGQPQEEPQADKR